MESTPKTTIFLNNIYATHRLKIMNCCNNFTKACVSARIHMAENHICYDENYRSLWLSHPLIQKIVQMAILSLISAWSELKLFMHFQERTSSLFQE